ncbi:peptide ABC transporter substrate-binding protein [Macrococcoides bohemicum]|uniref:Peptide ABC transporter substrate-binding protein n=1 Tax=Macrococcoides bohemicum TaxID=1903056 RepID=A0AAJ4TVV8_9STAP|nr:peptide ABC transporter substrate-binding protein [Macrococcus bohemicus]QYA41788.1 peptide ABC transporter substrate-binding protein [Macrococcus bohemicus]
MRKNYLWLIAFVLVLSSVLAACSGGSGEKDSKGKQVLNLVLSSDIPSMNSALATDLVSFEMYENVMEGLYRLDKDTKPVPALAEGDPKETDGGKTWTIKLRKDAKWSNGDPVTANDFVYAWRNVVDPKTASEYAFIMYDIENAQEINKGEKKPEELGVKAIDDNTLEIKLKNNQPYFKGLLAFGTYKPKNEKFAKKLGDKYGIDAKSTLYNGPFKIAEWKTEESVKLVKNDKYWDKDKVKLDEINYKVIKDAQTGLNLYETGKVDSVGVSAENVEKYKSNKDFKTELSAAQSFFRISYKGDHKKELSNKDLRLALAKSIDKDKYVKNNLNNGSVASNQLTPKDVYKGPDGSDFSEIAGGENLKFDRESAKENWQKAKAALGVDKLELELLTVDIDTAKRDAEYFKEQLESNLDGLTIKIKQQPFKQKLDLERKGQYDISYGNWFPDYADPMTFLDLFLSTETNTGYNNPAYDKLIEDAKGPLLKDPEARWKALGEASTMLLDDAALIPVIQRGSAYMDKPYVKGVVVNSSEINSYKEAYIEGKK